MVSKLSFSKTFRFLENALDIAKRRQSLISSNISNLYTPGYRGKDINFQSAMQQALDSTSDIHMVRTNAAHMGSPDGSLPEPEVVEEKGKWNGYNWMDIDQATMKLTENNLIYKTAAESLLRKISLMKEVIREGDH